jgi:hypothetical protein
MNGRRGRSGQTALLALRFEDLHLCFPQDSVEAMQLTSCSVMMEGINARPCGKRGWSHHY